MTEKMSAVEARLKENGIELPKATTPAGNYVPYVITGNVVYVSGQVPVVAGEVKYKGKCGQEYTIEEAAAAARICGINIISQLREACDGDLDRVERVVKLGGFVNCTPDFHDQPKVVNGCSDLMVLAFGEKGRHARSAVASPALPFNVCVEVDAIVEIKPRSSL